jgi:hypothetical protein
MEDDLWVGVATAAWPVVVGLGALATLGSEILGFALFPVDLLIPAYALGVVGTGIAAIRPARIKAARGEPLEGGRLDGG